MGALFRIGSVCSGFNFLFFGGCLLFVSERKNGVLESLPPFPVIRYSTFIVLHIPSPHVLGPGNPTATIKPEMLNGNESILG